MKINSRINPQDSLYHDAKFLLGIYTTASETTTFPLNDFFRSANQWNRKVNTWIMQTEGSWKWDDSNNTDLPIQIGNLTDLKQTTSLPSTALKIEKVEVLDISGNYQPVSQITDEEIKKSSYADSEFYKTVGLPIFYKLVGRFIVWYPKPSSSYVTLTNGYKIFFKKTSIAFNITDTSTQPGFEENFHRIISIGTVFDFVKNQEIKNNLTQQLNSLKSDLQEFYSSRDELKPQFVITRESEI